MKKGEFQAHALESGGFEDHGGRVDGVNEGNQDAEGVKASVRARKIEADEGSNIINEACPRERGGSGWRGTRRRREEGRSRRKEGRRGRKGGR